MGDKVIVGDKPIIDYFITEADKLLGKSSNNSGNNFTLCMIRFRFLCVLVIRLKSVAHNS